MIGALALAAAAAFAHFDPATPVRPGAAPLHCTDDRRWCAEISRDADSGPSALHVFQGQPTRTTAPAASFDLADDAGDAEFSLWPQILPLADPAGGLLLGVEAKATASYSGGGGSATELRVLRVGTREGGGVTVAPLLTAPLSASTMIRACFSDRDERARRGACHDEYAFAATFAPEPQATAGYPRLIYRTEATAYPAGASRSTDSTTRPPLKAADLVHARDPRCSYRRVFTFDAAKAAYVPDAPLPDCSDFTEP
jgi:hypothetical protein